MMPRGIYKRPSLEERFWNKVDKTSSCWFWTAAKNPGGYGRFRIKGKLYLSHRVSWMLYNGEIKDGLEVLHKCDNPDCVNPEHLYLGTQQDNIDDMFSKGRSHQLPKTHCPHGHPYSGDNLYTCPKGYRRCVECRREAWERFINKEKLR